MRCNGGLETIEMQREWGPGYCLSIGGDLEETNLCVKVETIDRADICLIRTPAPTSDLETSSRPRASLHQKPKYEKFDRCVVKFRLARYYST